MSIQNVSRNNPLINPAVISAAKQVDSHITNGNQKQAAKIAADFLRGSNVKDVDKLSPEQTLRLYNGYLHAVLSVGRSVERGERTAEEALDLITDRANLICHLRINDNQRADAARGAQEGVRSVVKHASREQLSRSARSLINAQNAIINLADSITDPGLRAQVLGEIKISNNQLAGEITQKLGAANNNEYENVFISGVQTAKNLYKITCDLTEQVVKMIYENRAEQNKLDLLAADKKREVVNAEKKEDEAHAVKNQNEEKNEERVADNNAELQKLQNALDSRLYLTPEDEERTKYEIAINKPNPIV
jgi:hypothetical protein